jgi:hypothetical protein
MRRRDTLENGKKYYGTVNLEACEVGYRYTTSSVTARYDILPVPYDSLRLLLRDRAAFHQFSQPSKAVRMLCPLVENSPRYSSTYRSICRLLS